MNLETLLGTAKGFLIGSPQINGGIGVSKGGQIGTTLDDVLFFKTARQKVGLFDGVLNPYKDNPWVYASISAIADNVANTPRQLKRRQGEEEVEIRDHPLLDLLDEPSFMLGGNQLMLGTVIFLEGWGEAFWAVRRDNPTDVPEMVELLNPSKMDPVVNEEGTELLGWTFRKGNGQKVPFMPWEIVHFKLFNPEDPLRGMPRWIAARQGIDQDFKANSFNAKFFEDNSLLSGVVKYKGELSGPQFKRLHQQFNDPDSLGSTPTRVAILDNAEEADFLPVPLTGTDIKFENLKKMSRAEVFAVYKTNEVVLGVYENVKSEQGQNDARKAWWQESLIPLTSMIADTLNRQLVSLVAKGLSISWNLAVVEALQEDFDKKLEHAEKLYKLSYPINAINKRLGLGMDDVEWGDVGMVQDKLKPVGKTEDLFVTVEPEVPAELPPKSQKALKSGEGEEAEIFVRMGGERVGEIVKGVINEQEEFEQKFEKKFKRWLMELRAETLANLERLKSYKDLEAKGLEEFVLDSVEAELSYKRIMSPAYFEAIEAGVASVDVELGIQVSGAFELTPSMQSAADNFLLTRIDKMAPVIVDTIKGNLTASLKQGILAGETTRELSDRVRGVMNTTGRRALTIARTESGSVVNGGRFLEMKEQKVQYTEWFTAGDAAVRGSHAAQNGEIVKLGDVFSNGLQFPNDPLGAANEIINCRCVAVAVEKRGGS